MTAIERLKNPFYTEPKHYMLTINNPTLRDLHKVFDICNNSPYIKIYGYSKKEPYSFFTCGFEGEWTESSTPSRTPHFQILLQPSSKMSFSTLKSYWPRAHIEVAKNVSSCYNYVIKEGLVFGLDSAFQKKVRVWTSSKK